VSGMGCAPSNEDSCGASSPLRVSHDHSYAAAAAGSRLPPPPPPPLLLLLLLLPPAAEAGAVPGAARACSDRALGRGVGTGVL
jgi:hypothetical protein